MYSRNQKDVPLKSLFTMIGRSPSGEPFPPSIQNPSPTAPFCSSTSNCPGLLSVLLVVAGDFATPRGLESVETQMNLKQQTFFFSYAPHKRNKCIETNYVKADTENKVNMSHLT